MEPKHSIFLIHWSGERNEMLFAVALKLTWHPPILSTRPASSRAYSSLAGLPRTCLNTAVLLLQVYQQESIWRQPRFCLWTATAWGVLSREWGPETKGNLKWQGLEACGHVLSHLVGLQPPAEFPLTPTFPCLPFALLLVQGPDLT